MSASDWNKLLKQLKGKPVVLQKFLRNCKPQDRKFGIASKKCERCGRIGAHLSQYNINLCRQCFRELSVN
jgi:ribosomal protein S14